MVKLGLQSFLQNLPSFGPDMLRWPLKSEEPSWGYQQEERIKPNTTQIVVWGFNIFLYFFYSHQLPSTDTEFTYKVKTEKKVECIEQKILFFFFCLFVFLLFIILLNVCKTIWVYSIIPKCKYRICHIGPAHWSINVAFSLPLAPDDSWSIEGE